MAVFPEGSAAYYRYQTGEKGVMAGRIPRTFINDLLARTDIIDLIDVRVPLKNTVKITRRVVLSTTKNSLFYSQQR